MATVNSKPTNYHYLIPDTEPDKYKIISASQKISRCIRLPELFNVVLECALEFSGAQKGIIYSIEEGKACARSEANREQNSRVFAQVLPKSLLSDVGEDDTSAAIIQHAIEVGKEVVINNPDILKTNCKQNASCSAPALMMAFPIICENETIAIIYLENRSQLPSFSKEIISLISVICEQAAISFQNVLHFDLLGEKIIKQMKRVQKIQKEIEATNCSRTDYLSFIDDAIRSKIGDVIGFSNLIQSREKTNPLNEETRHYLEHIQISTQELSEFLRNAYIFSTPFTADKLNLFETLDLKILINSVFQSNQDSAAKKSVAFKFNFKEPLPKMIYSDRGLINWILMTTIKKTIQVSHKNDTVDLTVSATNNYLKIAITRKRVRSKYIRVSDQMRKKLKNRGIRHRGFLHADTGKTPLSGAFFDFIDLGMIKKAVELLKGKISTTTKKHSSSLTITIPVNEMVAEKPQMKKQSSQIGKSLRKMSTSLANELLLDFKTLQSTPIYKGGTLYRIIRKAKRSCEGYNSKCPTLLEQIETAVFEGDKLGLKQLVNKLLAVHLQETASQ